MIINTYLSGFLVRVIRLRIKRLVVFLFFKEEPLAFSYIFFGESVLELECEFVNPQEIDSFAPEIELLVDDKEVASFFALEEVWVEFDRLPRVSFQFGQSLLLSINVEIIPVAANIRTFQLPTLIAKSTLYNLLCPHYLNITLPF